MGLYQDNFTGLSELERLAAMAHDPVRIHEIGADQWPLAMMACCMMASNDEEKQEENVGIYGTFAEKTSVAARRSSQIQLCRFISGRKGEGWKALIPYATQEPDRALARKAALQIITLAQPAPEQKLAGCTALVDLLCDHGPTALLDALLSTADMRVLPLLQPLERLSAARLGFLVESLDCTPNRLSCTWLLNVLSVQPELAEQVTTALCAMASKAPVIMDLVLPIPTWAFEKPVPQPLHGWTPAEYFARMLTELRPRLTDEQLSRVRAAYGAA